MNIFRKTPEGITLNHDLRKLPKSAIAIKLPLERPRNL